MALTSYSPGDSASGTVKEKFPLASAVVDPTRSPSMRMITSLPGSAVPVIVGVESLVLPPSAGDVIPGAAGSSVSIRKPLVFDGGESLPAGSVAPTNASWGPAASGAVGVKEKSPFPLAVVVPIEAPSTKTSTSAPGSARPVKVGVLSLVTSPSAGLFNVGAAGAVTSIAKSLMFDSPDVTPFTVGPGSRPDGCRGQVGCRE